MDDEVFKMVNIEGQVGFRRAGRFFFFVLRGAFLYICIYICFKQQQEAEVPCSQLAKKFRIREKGRKKKILRDGVERKEKVAKNRSVNT